MVATRNVAGLSGVRAIIASAVVVLLLVSTPAQADEQNGKALATSTTSGAPTPRVVVGSVDSALSLDGDLDLNGYIFQSGVPLIHSDGGSAYANTAVGLNALVSSTPGSPYPAAASRNSAFGYAALSKNTTGFFNTAIGARALFANTDGNRNTAVGYPALYANTSGYFNTAVGYRAMQYNTSGTGNTAIGSRAGINWTTGSSNIAIGRGANGSSGDSGVIRIGGTQQTATFIGGIHGATATGGTQVFVNSSGQLGTMTSSARFKQDIRELSGADDRLQRLRPVSFLYREELVHGDENPLEYGLIAEEVAAVFPELVTYDEAGRPHAVRYHLLTPLLLGEVQRQTRELTELHRGAAERDRVIADLRRQIQDLKRRD